TASLHGHLREVALRRTCPPRRRWRPAFSARSWRRGGLTGASAGCARVWRRMPPSPCAGAKRRSAPPCPRVYRAASISCERATAATTFGLASRHSWTNASRDGRESERSGVRCALQRNAYVGWKSEALKWVSFDGPATRGRAGGTALSRHRGLGGY